MDKSVWGPAGWSFIHACTFGYPERNPSKEHREGAYSFVKSLCTMLPCQSCRDHYTELVRSIKDENNTIFDSRNNFSRFFVNIHNEVNRSLSKEQLRYDYIERMYLLPTNCPMRKSNVRIDSYTDSIIITCSSVIMALIGIFLFKKIIFYLS